MTSGVGAWFSVCAACVLFIAGCSSDTGPEGASGGTGSAGSPSDYGDRDQCVGELADVAATWGDCPATLCAAQAWAGSCSTHQHQTTLVGSCDMLTVVTIDMGSTHGKDCYYDLNSDGEPKLVGAASWDDTPGYCNFTAFRIEAGKTSPNCSALTNTSTVVCGAGGAGNLSGTEAAPPACYNAQSHACEPC